MEQVGDQLELAEVIGALRDSLATAQSRGRDAEGPKFKVSKIEVEVTVEIARTAEGGAGIKFWVVQVGGRGARTGTSTHRVLLALETVEDSYAISRPDSAIWEKERA